MNGLEAKAEAKTTTKYIQFDAYKSAATLQHCDFVLLSKHIAIMWKSPVDFPKLKMLRVLVYLEIQISIFNKLNIYSYLWDSKIKNISKLKIVTNEIIKNYICEKQVSIKECIWHTNLKFNVQSIN